MKKGTDLTEGNILPKIIGLTLPIIGTSFVQMAYNLTDVIWLGRSGSATVTAVTTAGFFMWLLLSLFYCTKAGTETLVAQAVGKKDLKMAGRVAENALTFAIYGSILFNLLILLSSGVLLNFFKLEPDVMGQALGYLRLVSFGMFFAVINPTCSAVFIGFGNSRTPFIVSSMGLVLNIILDPILIFGLGPVPALGAKGAAIATVFANVLVFSVFLFQLKSGNSVLKRCRLFAPMDKKILRNLLKIGIPVTIQQVAFCLISMYIGRIVSAFGTIPLGVQNVGASIEALSWNTALGFSTALGSFTGQNYGAFKFDRIRKGYFIVLSLSLSLGLVATLGFYFFGDRIFSLFTSEPVMGALGAQYLKILAVSQMFMCLEIISAGGFYGLGRTRPPSLTSVLFTGLRIPAALWVVSFTSWGYAGVWWCISISSVFKGVIVPSWYLVVLNGLSRINPGFPANTLTAEEC
ncbi:MAG: MATE family efflux transporter [Desulfobacteraceae bacterium]|nr:MATE family efflux transporter [Desulfobacteraceae bacterium]